MKPFKPPYTLADHIAMAYIGMAKINHYLLTVDIAQLHLEDMEKAEQRVITLQNEGPQKGRTYNVLELALNLLEMDIKKKRDTGYGI